jgi:hypothetical protein
MELSEGDISQKPLAMNVAINVNAASARANPSTDINQDESRCSQFQRYD